MRVSENTWMFGDNFLTFHGFWRRTDYPVIIFVYIENGEVEKLNIHFAHITTVIGDDWIKRDSLTDDEKELLLKNRNALKVDNNTIQVNI